MLVKIFTCGADGYNSLFPINGDDYTVNLFHLPRSYCLRIDEINKPYILCPNGESVYELDQSRKDSETVKFSYNVGERKRTVRLHIDKAATHDMFFSGEDYRGFP